MYYSDFISVVIFGSGTLKQTKNWVLGTFVCPIVDILSRVSFFVMVYKL